MASQTLSERVQTRQYQLRAWAHMLRPQMIAKTNALIGLVDVTRVLALVIGWTLSLSLLPRGFSIVVLAASWIALWFGLSRLALIAKDRILARAFATLSPDKVAASFATAATQPLPMSSAFGLASKPKSAPAEYEGPPKHLRNFDDDALDFDDADEYAPAPSYAAASYKSSKSSKSSKPSSSPVHASAYADKDAVDFDDAA